MVKAQENLQTTAARQAAKVEMQEHIIEHLSVTIASQAKTISQLTKLTEKLIKEQREQATTTACPQEDIISAFQELQLRESKKTNLVVVKEGADEPTTKTDDEKMALKICTSASIPPDAIEKIFRHGIRKPGKSRHIKICFRDKNAPAQILPVLRRNLTFAQVLPRGSRIRRDITLRELELEYSARK
ncbi:hypothetical protein Tcan_15681 [Toxocara canis]|uniref:Uncharacterized protein n=1 Tax=Toxocara canis TaxID=6265 RepID=A0A0B2UPV8_TOXCA|nr:hypothetical protein Tcan_15681 [Toxocara canis]